MFKDLNNEQFRAHLDQHENAVVLDVRTPEEWEEGIIAGAVKINIMSPDFAMKVQELDKSKHYLIYCRSGVRSVNACNAMASMGFGDLYNLESGILGWDGETV